MKTLKMVLPVLVILSTVVPVAWGGDFDFLMELDHRAREDHASFSAQMSLQFGLPVPRIDEIIRRVDRPSDAFMVLRIGQLSHRSYDDVFHEYEANKGNGWGQIAKNMGIKPGSKEFHELKNGPGGSSKGGPSGGNGGGRSKGKKGKGK